MSTLSELFTLRLPDYWTPAEALAVYEFLNDLADAISNRYEVALLEQLRSERDDGDSSQPDLFDFDDPIPF
jgi:hypothetical protein